MAAVEVTQFDGAGRTVKLQCTECSKKSETDELVDMLMECKSLDEVVDFAGTLIAKLHTATRATKKGDLRDRLGRNAVDDARDVARYWFGRHRIVQRPSDERWDREWLHEQDKRKK